MRYFSGATGITTLQWPARVPDMNPIGHFWDELGKKVRSRERPQENFTVMLNAFLYVN